MSGSTSSQQPYEEDTASLQQQPVAPEAPSDRVEQPQQERHASRHDDKSTLSSALIASGGPGSSESTCINSHGGALGRKTQTRVSSCTNTSSGHRAASSPRSGTGGPTDRVKDGSTSSNTDSCSPGRGTAGEGGLLAASSIEWRLPAATSLCIVQEQKAAESAAHQVPSGQQHERRGAGQDDESGTSSGSSSSSDTGARGDTRTNAGRMDVRSRTGVHRHDNESCASMSDAPDLFLCVTANASPTSHASAHMAELGRGFFQSSNSSVHKRVRRDSSSSSSSCSEQDGCTGTTPLECSPSFRASPHTLPSSAAVPACIGETAPDDSRLTQEEHGEERDRDDVAGARLHAALLQRLCATPRRRKLSSSSSSAASDGQQTVASISSPAMLYAPLRTIRGGPAQQQLLQLQQDKSHAQPAQQREPQEQLHDLQTLGFHESHDQRPQQLPQPEQPLSMSTLPEQQLHQEKQQMRQQPEQHSLRMSREMAFEGKQRTQKEVGGLLLGQSDTPGARGNVQTTAPRDLGFFLRGYEAPRTTVEVAGLKGATLQCDSSTSHSAGGTGHQGATAYQSYAITSQGEEVAAPPQSGGGRTAFFRGTAAAPGVPTVHGTAGHATVVSSAFAAGYSRDSALNTREQQLQHTNPSSPLAVMQGSDSLQQQRQQQQENASSAFAAVSQMLQQHLGGHRTRSLIDQGADGVPSTCGGDAEASRNLRSTSMLEAANQQAPAASGAAACQSALYPVGLSDEKIVFREAAPPIHPGGASAGSDAVGERSGALLSSADAGLPAVDIPAGAAGSLAVHSAISQDFDEADVREHAQAARAAAAADESSRLVHEREEVSPENTAACSGATLEHSREFFNRLLQQFAVQRARSTPAADPPTAAAFVSPCVGHSPQLCVASPAEVPASAEAAARPKDAVSVVQLEDGVQALNEAQQPLGAADAALLGTVTAGDATPSIARPLCDTRAPSAPNGRSTVEAPVAADTRLGDAATGGTAVGGVAVGGSSTLDRGTEAGAAAEEGTTRPSFGSTCSQEQDTQQLRVQQLLQALQEHRRRLGIMVEQTLARMMQTLDPVENNMLQTRVQRFQQQQHLLLQLQQRLESRSLPFYRHDSGAARRMQQQEHDQEGKQQGGDQQEQLQREQQQRRPHSQGFLIQEGGGQGRMRSGRRRLPQNNGAGELTEENLCTGTEGEAGQVGLAAGTGEANAWRADASAEALRGTQKRPHDEVVHAAASNPAAADGLEAPTITEAASAEGVAQRYAMDAGRDADFVLRHPQKQDKIPFKTDGEMNVAALKKQQHQEDMAALMRVKRTFLHRQQQHQSIPLPEESASEMYWASLLQPTEMLLDRTVALTTSLIQPGVYVYLNKCFWESNQRDWASHQAYPYSCSSSSCSSSVPCHIPRPAVDLLPVYYSSHCTPVQTLAGLPPTAAAAAAVAPSDADSILNFCFRVSLLRRGKKRQQPTEKHRTHPPVHRDQNTGQNSSSTTSSSSTNSNSGSDISGNGSGVGSRRTSRGDGVASAVEETRNAGVLPLDVSDSTSAHQHFLGSNNERTCEQTIQSLLPFPSNISSLQSTSAEPLAAAGVSATGAAAAKDPAAATRVGGTKDTAKDACCGAASDRAAGDADAALRFLRSFPVLPALELKGPHPAWVLGATHAAAVAAKAGLAAAGISDGGTEETERETDVCFDGEEAQQQGLYAAAVPVSLYGFSLSRRLAAAARDAAFNQIAAAAAVVAATSRTPSDAVAAAGATGSAQGEQTAMPRTSEQLIEIPTKTDAGVSECGAADAPYRDSLSGATATTRGAAAEGRHGLAEAKVGRRLCERRRSSMSSTSSRDCRHCTREGLVLHRGETRGSSARIREEFDGAWYEVYRDMLLRRDPPLRKAWVCSSNRRRGSSSDHRNIHWNRGGHVSGALSGYGSNSPSPFGVSWRPAAQRSTWGGGGGGSTAGGKDECYFGLRDQQQSSAASLDIHTQAEGIFVLRERDTGLPVAVRATVFCPDEESIRDESTVQDATTSVTETAPPGGGGAFGISSSKSSRHSSPTRVLQQHGQARRGGTGSAAAAVASGSNIQQGGQLLSKLFVVAAHATSAEEPMPVKLRRVKQMAKAWFRHKKLLALLLYWQRSQQQQRRTLEAMHVHEQQAQHSTREGKKDWRKRATSEVATAAARAAEMQFHQHQESSDEARRLAETRGVVEQEALAGLLKDEREEARYISHLHFLAHALVSRLSSLVAAASLAWCSTSQAGPGDSSRRKQNKGDAKHLDNVTLAETGIRSTSVTCSNSTHKPGRDDSGGKNPEQSGYDRDSTSTISVSDTRGTSDTGEGALPTWHSSSRVAEGDEKQERRGSYDEETTADSRTSCWSLRIGLRWRESYFAFEYYVAAVYMPLQPQTPAQQRQRQPQSPEVKHEDEQQPEQRQLEQCQQKQRYRAEEQQHEQRQEQHGGDDHAAEEGHIIDGRDSTSSSKRGRSSSRSGWSDKAGGDGADASAVLLLDEMLQPCLCDVMAVQHAFQAVVVRLLPFLCIKSFMLRLLLEQSSELRNLSTSILHQWGGAPPRAPKQPHQRHTCQQTHQEQLQLQQEQEQQGEKDASQGHRSLPLDDITVIDDVAAAVEKEERLQRSAAVAIAAAFHESSGGASIDASTLETAEQGLQAAGGDSAFLPLFLLDCLLQSSYPPATDSDPIAVPRSAASVGSAAAAFASAVSAAAGAAAGDDPQQLDGDDSWTGAAAVSLLLAARVWGAHALDSSRSRSTTITGKRTELSVEKSWFPFRLQGLKKERSSASRIRRLLLGTLSRRGSATATAPTTYACSSPPASAAVGPCAAVSGEDQTEACGPQRDDTAGKEQRKKELAANLEKQIKWISARCSYIGVTDAPASSLKAALLLALLFPSQRQLLLEHLQLRDQLSQGKAPRPADAPGIAARTVPAPLISESPESQQGVGAVQSPQRLGKEQHELQGEKLHLLQQKHRPQDAEQQVRLRQDGSEGLPQKLHYQEQEPPEQHDDGEVMQTNIQKEEIADARNEEYMERVIVAAEMMLEGALEELWPGKEDEENTWEALFRNRSTKREVIEETCMLETEIPFFVAKEALSPAEAEAVAGTQLTERVTDRPVAAAEGESLPTRRMSADESHVLMSDVGDQYEQKQEDSEERQEYEDDDQGQEQPEQTSERQRDRLAPQRTEIVKEEGNVPSFENKTATSAEIEEEILIYGRQSAVPPGTPGVIAAATGRASRLILYSAKNPDANVSSELKVDRPLQDSEGVAGKLHEQHPQQRGDGEDFKSDVVDQQGGEGRRSTAKNGERQSRATPVGEADEEAHKKTDRLKQLLLLPVELCDPSGPDEGAAAVVEGGLKTGAAYEETEGAKGQEPAHQRTPQQQRHSELSSRQTEAVQDAHDEIGRGGAGGDTGGKRSKSAFGRTAADGLTFIPSKGVLFFSAFPSAYSDSALPDGDALSAAGNTCKISFAPLWARPTSPLPNREVAASITWYSAAALRLVAANLVSPGVVEGRYHVFGEGRGVPIARGGADLSLLLRWCSSCLANSNRIKGIRSSITRSSRAGGMEKGTSSSGVNSYLDDQETFSSSSRRAGSQENTRGETAGFQAADAYATTVVAESRRDGASEAVLDKLLLACSSKRRPQQPPLWAGGIDVSSLREGLDYRIDWRADCDIGDGHVDPPAAEEGASSSTIVDSSSSEEETTAAEERDARGSRDGKPFPGTKAGTDTEHADSGRGIIAGRRAAAAAEYYGETTSGVDESSVRHQEKKKSLRERLLSSASAGRAAGGREQSQVLADGKQARVSDYVEERLVDQQLRDFLQGLFTTVRHATAATLAPKCATQLPRTTGTTSGRFLPAAGVYQEDAFSASALEVGAAASSGGETFPKQSVWSTGGAAPAWLFSLAAAEAAQRQLRAAETGLLPGTSSPSGIWSYLLLPAANAQPPMVGSASPSPAGGGRVPLRQQQEEAKKQQESKTIAASALAAAAAMLREQQQGLHGGPGGSAAMPWTSLYLAAATDAAAAAAAAARQPAAPPGCQTRHRAEMSLPSSTCSTPRSPHHPSAPTQGVGGSVSCRRGTGWRSVPASPSPAGAADAAVAAAATAAMAGSGRETFGSGRVDSCISAAAAAAAGSTGSSRSSTSTSAGGAAPSWAHATAGVLSSSNVYGSVGAGGVKPADSSAAGPNPLASALLAALQQQPPPTHCLPHHFFPQHPRLSQQHAGPPCATSPCHQQQLQRRVSWETEMRHPPADSPNHSRRSSSSLRGAEAGNERSTEQFLESSRGIASAAADALQQLQQADVSISVLSGRKLLQSDEEVPVSRVSGANERGGSGAGLAAAGGIQPHLGEVLQRLSQQGSSQEGLPRVDQELAVGDVQMEAMLQQLATVLLPSSPVNSTPPNEEAVPTARAGTSYAGSGKYIEATELAGAASAQRIAGASLYRLPQGGVSTTQGEWPASTSVAARQDEQLARHLHQGSAGASAGVPEAATDASRTQARQQKLQEVLRALAVAVEESEGRDNRETQGARTNAELQQLMAVKHCLETAMEQGRVAPFLVASRADASDRAAAAGSTVESFNAVSPQGSRTPDAAGAVGSVENELEIYSLLYGQTGRGAGLTSAVQQHLQVAGTEGLGVALGADCSSLKDAHSLIAGNYAGAAEAARRGFPVTREASALSALTSAVAASAGRGVVEDGYGAPGGGSSSLNTEDGLETAAGALGSAGGFADIDAVVSPIKKKRSRYALAGGVAEASAPSSAALGMGERGHGSSRSPSRGHATGLAGGASAAASLSSSGRSRRSRRGSSTSRRSGDGLTGTPRGSSGAGLEMAAAAAAATAELSAREEAGAVTPRKGRNRSRWSGSLSPSPVSRQAGDAGGQQEEGGGAVSPHLKQQAAAGAAGGGEDEMVPLGALPTGVYFDVARRLWRCQWREEGRLKSKGFSLGHYATLEEAREACILYKCAVSNIPLDPAWLVPEYLPASMASKRLVKHRQSSSVPPTSQENSPAATGTEEPHSPLAAGSSIASAFTSTSCDKGLAGGFSRYGTPTTPRSALVASSTDECSSASHFLSPPTFSAAASGVGSAAYLAGDPSIGSSSSTLLPCLSRTPGAVTASRTESCYTQDSRRSGITSSSPRRSSFDSDAAASFLSTESSRQPQRGLQQLYPGDSLLPMTPSSDTETATGQSSASNRKRRRFACATAAVGEEAAGEDVSQIAAASHSSAVEVRSAPLTAPQEAGAARVYVGDRGVSSFSASHSSSGDVEHEAQEGPRTAWLPAGVLSESDRQPEEVAEDGEDEAHWPSASDVKGATAAVNAGLSEEAPDFWSVGGAALRADALPAVGTVEGSLNVGRRRSTSQSPHRQLSLLTAAAADAVPLSGAPEENQHSFAGHTEGGPRHAGLATETPERVLQPQPEEMASQQRTSVSPLTGEQQAHPESEEEQRVRLVELLRLVAGAASEDKSCHGASSSSELPSSTP